MRVFVVIFLLFSNTAFPQRTLSLEDCQKQFLEKNFLILASHYNIDVAKAATIQSATWDNPVLLGYIHAYNPKSSSANESFFNVGQGGSKGFGLQQLISLGAKKKTSIEYSQANVERTEYEFKDIMRNLGLELRKTFYSLYFDTQKIEAIESQIAKLDTLVKLYEVQVAKQNIAPKDLVRLKSLLLSLEADRYELIRSSIETETQLKLLISSDDDIVPLFDMTIIYKERDTISISIEEMQRASIENRPDMLAVRKQREASQYGVNMQAAIGIPDITIGVIYDQMGGAFAHEIDLTLGIPLPFWNRNQGGIAQAEALLSRSKIEEKAYEQRVKTEVVSAFKKWKEAKKNNDKITEATIKSLNDVYEGMVKNFQRRNISTLEFVDFMQMYSTTMMQRTELKKILIISREELNAVVNKNIF